MIAADIFYASFAEGFASQKTAALIVKRRGRIPKYSAPFGNDELSFWFRVNGKASAFPNLPGEFWLVIETKLLRYDAQDRGLVSWYQYSDESMNDEMTAFQWSIYAKVEGQAGLTETMTRAMTRVHLPQLRREIEGGFRVGSPHSPLFYLNEPDARFWGKLFAVHLRTWVERFCANPETLQQYMWRVHWTKTAS